MSVRQVTPVNKVVKCHVNSVDGTPAYEGGVAYEAGTLVTLDGVSYVSIVDIEDTDADTPPAAPDRWSVSPDSFASSSGGGGGSGLETRVAALEGEMTVAQGDIDALELSVADKVDKVAGKGLSENDYTDADAAIVAGVTSALADKVDKVAGKGLSENDYTDADAAIVAGVTSALADKVDKVAGKGLSENDYTDADAAVVASVPTDIAFLKGNSLVKMIDENVSITSGTTLIGAMTSVMDSMIDYATSLENDEILVPFLLNVPMDTSGNLIALHVTGQYLTNASTYGSRLDMTEGRITYTNVKIDLFAARAGGHDQANKSFQHFVLANNNYVTAEDLSALVLNSAVTATYRAYIYKKIS